MSFGLQVRFVSMSGRSRRTTRTALVFHCSPTDCHLNQMCDEAKELSHAAEATLTSQRSPG